MRKTFKIILWLLIFGIFFSFPFFGEALSIGGTRDFNVEEIYDHYNRNRVSAFLHNTIGKLSFFVNDYWWEGLSNEERNNINRNLESLASEFNNHIYPQMTSVFGSEQSHPVDRSNTIAVLFHRMTRGTGGYVNTADFFSVLQAPKSNELNMLYINSDFALSPFLRGFLAHEFMHMITFNAKERQRGIREEIWLNEARAEYAPTFMGYFLERENNILKRKNNFLNNPGNSLTEWRNTIGDYGIVNMFVHYLVDHYGVEILADSLNSNYVGIESINYALRKNGHSENFSDIFTDWTIAVLVNDCSFGPRYCYKNEFLTDLRIVPSTTYLSTQSGTSILARHSTKNWAGNWFRFIGSSGNLKLDFRLEQNLNYRLPYILCVTENSCTLNFLELDNQNKGTISVKDFGEKYFSLTIIPSIQHKTAGFNGVEPSIFFNWSASLYSEEKETVISPDPKIAELLNTIQMLTQEINRLRNILAMRGGVGCRVDQNLFVGITGSNQVRCLQEFLRAQGSDIYPQGLITGNFFSLTRDAVIRFQERHALEILTPLGLTRGTGHVGLNTRNKINQLIGI